MEIFSDKKGDTRKTARKDFLILLTDNEIEIIVSISYNKFIVYVDTVPLL